MAEWKPKRNWSKVTTDVYGNGFAVFLDANPVRTPAQHTMILPTRNLALLVADEWRLQEEFVEMENMPFTRMSNAGLDTTPETRSELNKMLADYCRTDLLYYRATEPRELRLRQHDGWDPVLSWIQSKFQAKFVVTSGVMPVSQPKSSVERLISEISRMDGFEICALRELVTMTGSLLLGIAAIHNFRLPLEIWQLSRIDEEWQRDKWGSDELADQINNDNLKSFLNAHRFAESLDGSNSVC